MMSMRRLFVCAILIGLLWLAGTSSAEVYFQENFNQGDAPYSFGWYKFGYSDNPIQTFHENSTGVNGSGCHRIPLGGPSRTNFDVHFGKNLNWKSEYYCRFYLYVNETFNTDPYENWKLTYNYTQENNETPFVFWMRPTSDGFGFQPTFFSAANNADVPKLPGVPTFYLRNFKAQWICFEYYVSIPRQWVKLWITTPGGEYNETLYIDSQLRNAGSAVNSFKLGAYWDGTGDSNYFRLDELAISDQYNGPLGGRSGDQSSPLPPTGVRTVPNQ